MLRRSYALLLMALPALFACDVAGPGTDPLVVTQQVSFEFRFSGAPTEPVASTEAIDLGPLLQQRGVLKGEVIAARVRSVRLDLDQPLEDTFAGVMSGIEVRLTTPSASQTIATATGLPADDELMLTSSAVVTSLVVAPTFRAALAFTGLQARPVYVLRARIELEIEAEGV